MAFQAITDQLAAEQEFSQRDGTNIIVSLINSESCAMQRIMGALCVGCITDQKNERNDGGVSLGTQDYLRIMRSVQRSFPRVRLTFAGNDAYGVDDGSFHEQTLPVMRGLHDFGIPFGGIAIGNSLAAIQDALLELDTPVTVSLDGPFAVNEKVRGLTADVHQNLAQVRSAFADRITIGTVLRLRWIDQLEEMIDDIAQWGVTKWSWSLFVSGGRHHLLQEPDDEQLVILAEVARKARQRGIHVTLEYCGKRTFPSCFASEVEIVRRPDHLRFVRLVYNRDLTIGPGIFNSDKNTTFRLESGDFDQTGECIKGALAFLPQYTSSVGGWFAGDRVLC